MRKRIREFDGCSSCVGPFFGLHFSKYIYLFAIVVVGGGGVIYLFISFRSFLSDAIQHVISVL